MTMLLSRAEREELRIRVDVERRHRLLRIGADRDSLAAQCYEAADGDPERALLLALDHLQRQRQVGTAVL